MSVREQPQEYSLAGARASAVFSLVALVDLLRSKERIPRNQEIDVLVLCTPQAKANFELCAQELRKQHARAQCVDIPLPTSEWQLDEAVMQARNQLRELGRQRIELHLDITQAFRSVPFLLSALAMLLESSGECRLAGFYCGVMEAKGDNPVPMLDLRRFLELSKWRDAVNEFKETGWVRTLHGIVGRFEEDFRNKAGKDKRRRWDNALKNLSGTLGEFSEVRAEGLPLESGLAAHKVTSAIDKLANTDGEELLGPIEMELLEGIAKEMRPIAAPSTCKLKKDIPLDDYELKRQRAFIEILKRGRQIGQAASCLRELLVNREILAGDPDSPWLDVRNVRSPAERRLDSRSKKGALYLDAGDLRNKLMHAGFRLDTVKDPEAQLQKLIDRLDEDEAKLAPSGSAVILPVGSSPELISTANKHIACEATWLLGTRESLPEGIRVAEREGLRGVLTIELPYAHGDLEACRRIMEKLREDLRGKAAVHICLTGGTTLMTLLLIELWQALPEAAAFLLPPTQASGFTIVPVPRLQRDRG